MPELESEESAEQKGFEYLLHWKSIKSKYNNNKFKISTPTWNDEFDWPDSSYSISDIQDYFEFIITKQETLTENPLV